MEIAANLPSSRRDKRGVEIRAVLAERDNPDEACSEARLPLGDTNIVATTAAADVSATAELTLQLRLCRGSMKRFAGASRLASRSRWVVSRTCAAQVEHSGQMRRCVSRRSSANSDSSPSS
jgi:hypothetical protein